MSEEKRAEEMQTGGEASAQNTSADAVQLQQTAPDESVPAGENGSGAPSAGTAKSAAAEQGASGEETQNAADAPDASQEAETRSAPADGDDGHEDKVQSAQARAETATARLAEALASAAIEKAGIPAARAKYAAKLMDTSHIDPLADDAAQKYAEAVRHLVEDIPELAPARSTGSSGEHPRKAQSISDDPFARGLSGR